MKTTAQKREVAATRMKTKSARSPKAPIRKAETPKITILLADDHLVVRQGMAAIIGTEPDLDVVGVASDGEEACALYSRLRPTVLILDLRMPVLDGFEVVKRIIASEPGARILIMTTYDTDEDIWRCLRAGAKGYLLKDASQPEIVQALRTVARGETFVAAPLATQLARRAQAPELTTREREVLGWLDAGKTNKEIASALGVGEGTIKTHVKQVLHKLGATTRTEAVGLARERGLVRRGREGMK
jgi:two-component system, NarL family, response regulator